MGWSTENLGDLYKIGSSKRVLKSQWQTSGVPFYRGREITILSKQGEVSNELFISEELYQEYAKKHGVPATEDIVITAIGTIGNSYIVSANDRFYFKDASVLWLKKTSNVDSSFINLWLKSPLMREQLDEGNGATVDTLTIKKLQSLQVKLPPIPEQQRIVAILDQAFADIEKARANAEKNLKNARELFDSYLNQVFSQRGEGWKKFNLGDIAEVSSGGTPIKSTKDYWNGSIPWYSSGELNRLYTRPSKEMITEKGLRESNAKLFPEGSLLIGMYDTAALKMSILDRAGCFNQAIAGVKPNQKVNLVFIYHTINFLKLELLLLRRGVRQKNLNQSKIKGISIGLPSVEEQNEVVLLLQSLKSQSDKLADIYTQKLASLDELKKSLLQKAFSGELTKTEGQAA